MTFVVIAAVGAVLASVALVLHVAADPVLVGVLELGVALLLPVRSRVSTRAAPTCVGGLLLLLS